MDCCICYEKMSLKNIAVLMDISNNVVCSCETGMCVDCAEKLQVKRCPTCRVRFAKFVGVKKSPTPEPKPTPQPPPTPLTSTPFTLLYTPQETFNQVDRANVRRIIEIFTIRNERRPTNQRIRYALQPQLSRDGVFSVNDDVLLLDKPSSQYPKVRAKIVKINRTGFTCQYYKHIIEYDNDTGLPYKVWVDKLHPDKKIIKNVAKVDRRSFNQYAEEWYRIIV